MVLKERISMLGFYACNISTFSLYQGYTAYSISRGIAWTYLHLQRSLPYRVRIMASHPGTIIQPSSSPDSKENLHFDIPSLWRQYRRLSRKLPLCHILPRRYACPFDLISSESLLFTSRVASTYHMASKRLPVCQGERRLAKPLLIS